MQSWRWGPTNSLVIKSSFYPNCNEFNSYPLFFSLTGSSCESSNDSNRECWLNFTLQNTASVAVDTGNVSNPQQEFSITCESGVISNVTHICDNGHVMEGYCSDTTAGVFTSYCPIDQVVSVCNSLSSDNSPVGSGCVVLGYTENTVECSCPPNGSPSNTRRHLQDSFNIIVPM